MKTVIINNGLKNEDITITLSEVAKILAKNSENDFTELDGNIVEYQMDADESITWYAIINENEDGTVFSVDLDC